MVTDALPYLQDSLLVNIASGSCRLTLEFWYLPPNNLSTPPGIRQHTTTWRPSQKWASSEMFRATSQNGEHASDTRCFENGYKAHQICLTGSQFHASLNGETNSQEHGCIFCCKVYIENRFHNCILIRSRHRRTERPDHLTYAYARNHRLK